MLSSSFISDAENPLVSIIIPTFNRVSSLINAINSALNQSYSNIEVIIIDDFSSDETKERLSALVDTRLVYHRLETNIGMPYSWGVGLKLARGKYVCFLGDDDQLRINYVQNRMQYMVADPKMVVTYSPYDECNEQGRVVAVGGPSVMGPVKVDSLTMMEMALNIQWFIGATMYRKEAILSIWEEAKDDGYVFDVGLHTRLVLEGVGSGMIVPENDVKNTKHSGQTSYSKSRLIFQQKSDLLAHLLEKKPSKLLAQAIESEAAHWHSLWGRRLAAEGLLQDARMHFAEAVRLQPMQPWVWKQIIISWVFPGRMAQAN